VIDNEEGYIGLYRCLLNKPIWTQSTPEQKTILITLLLMVNHKNNEWIWQGEKCVCKPGQKVTSLESIQKKCGKGISVRNIRTALERFEKLEFLTNKSTKQGRLITILNWHLYQVELLKTTNKTTVDRQTTDKDLTTNKNDKNDKNDKKYIYSSEHIRLAEKLKGSILSNNPNAKTPEDLSKWAADFEKMMRIDKRTEQQIETVMEFSQKDQFWKSNILSAGKLREQFDKLWLQKDKQRPGYSNKPPQAGNFTQREHDSNYFEGAYKDV
jgi:vacuolar-type H+-ATPase subunit I/STV1